MNTKQTKNNKPIKYPSPKNIILNHYECHSPIIEKYVLGALVKSRDLLYYNPDLDIIKKNMPIEKVNNFKANIILSEIMNNPNCPKELQELTCTVFYLNKGGGYQFWGNVKHYISVSAGEDTILVLIN